mgnify:CR=1 FL=1
MNVKRKIMVFALILSLIVPLYSASANISNEDALEYLNRPPIVNSTLSASEFAAFQDTVNKALDLLQAHDPDAYIRVCLDVKQIKYQEKTEELNALAVSSYNGVIITGLFVDQPDKFTPVFVAGVLSHESLHAAVMNNFFRFLETLPPFMRDFALKNLTIDNREEVLAYQCGKNTLIKLNAPQWMIESDRELQREYMEKIR